ncbi:NAD-dependent epimerase/dehydratase family protein [Mycobacterium sp. pUA109]|uniref:NAD-dependent epimerase/dehydratase family protein n=1 Tax=Mycobacterium sp. pUA109 TaxID=3238982 RepID=UPI00351B03DE
MKVLVAGATSVPGPPVIRALCEQGHDVVGLTRSSAKAAAIAESGARPLVVDVLDAAQTVDALAEVSPDVVVSLLITLPKRGPMRMRDFEPTRMLWDRGVPNLVTAAQRAGVRRIVAESVIFAYGYAPTGDVMLDESDPYPGPPPRRGAPMLEAMRGMERAVLSSGDTTATKGIVLRYGAFYGRNVPHAEMITTLVKWWALPVPGGDGILSWIDIDDLARATVAAIDHGRGGQIYNIVDDTPRSFRDYTTDLATRLHRPRPITVPNRLVRLAAPYMAEAFGTARLPVSNAKAKAELRWTPADRR